MLNMLINDMVELRKAFSQRKFAELRFIANKIIDSAALRNDSLRAEIAVVAYALHKLASKEHVTKNRRWKKASSAIISAIDSAIDALRKQNFKKFEKMLTHISKNVSAVDDYLGNYVQSTIDKARVKMASAAYAHGLSLSKAAKLTATDTKKLQSYIGITKIHDEDTYVLSIKQRLDALKKSLGEAE